ncbi:hypothetical protein PF005_g13854 [Phytophthora fragariae]|uniref:RxLR effector protein n=2 Tax=Phytophthora TaxID=4783 RepID=A0A6A3ENK0_9STRA|nr:hypothetical protein PF003_g32008 [Phytophthora fragariae]KAE9016131.1 hypothetical protein PR002_g13746 [Phytophthora rubi]KAE8935045.1 hypothetical protein PF009_g14992 [Phytophthora fragariae]KAE9004013.1 hypothetical protein PF011_g12641 [Phytophthora fragariae]KAE9021694.1 hypothetical protein PR001_g13320 [Phytophthora rubi]
MTAKNTTTAISTANFLCIVALTCVPWRANYEVGAEMPSFTDSIFSNSTQTYEV